MVEDNDTSLLSSIGKAVAFLFAPLGFDSWKATVATFTGLIAKEEVVGTFGVLYGGVDAENGAQPIWAALSHDFTQLSAYKLPYLQPCCVRRAVQQWALSSGK